MTVTYSRHICHGKPRIGTKVVQPGAGVLDDALGSDRVPLQLLQNVEDDVLSADAPGRPPDEADLDDLGDLEPGLARDEGHDDVGGAHADGQAAVGAAAARVAVAADDELARLRALAEELGMHDGVIVPLELGHLERPPRRVRLCHELLGQVRLVVARLHHVVTRDPEPVVAEYARVAQTVVDGDHALAVS